jgi:hypothetical protein
MGARGRQRFEQELAWSRQVPNLLAAYERALSKSAGDVNLRKLRWWRRGWGQHRGSAGAVPGGRPAR